MHITNRLKYIRAPMLNECWNNKTLFNRQLIIKTPNAKVYIRSPRWRYKLLAATLKKITDDRFIRHNW